MKDLVASARALAFQWHEGHERKYTEEPYTVHLEEVAKITSEAKGASSVMEAAA